MKPTTLYISLVTAALTAACSNDEPRVDYAPVAASITAGVAGPGTRAIGNTWNADHIGITVTGSPLSDMKTRYGNRHYSTTAVGTTSADFSPATADDGIFFQNAGETVTFAAYAPYQPAQPGALPGTDGIISHSIDTADFTPEKLSGIDFLWASATGKAASPQVNFTFKHTMSRLTFIFLKGEGLDELKDIRYELYGLCPNGTFNTLTGQAKADTAIVPTFKYSIPVPFSTDMRSTIMAFPEQEGTLSLTVVMDGKSYMTQFPMVVEPGTSNRIPLAGGHSYTYNVTLKKNALIVEQATIYAWEEEHPQDVPAVY